jgi:PAS domain S-box-containing protein
VTPEPVISESAEDLYENAPCGYIVAGPDRSIINVNATLLAWLGYERNALTGKPFTDLLAVGSLIHYETHFAPLLQLEGQLAGVTVDLVTADGTRLPVFVTANTKSDTDGSGSKANARGSRCSRGPCSARCCRPCFHLPRVWRRLLTTTPLPPTMSEGISTTCSRSHMTSGPSSSAT